MTRSADPTPPQPAEPGSEPFVSAAQRMLFVQSIKGAPASVLLALALSGRFMFHKELMVWTRCGHAQVTQALETLVAMGRVLARTRRGPWMLASGRQLPVDFFFDEGSALKALNDDDDTDRSSKREKTSLSARREHLLQLLDQSGIEEPTASELADLPYMSADYIQAHVAAAKTKGLRVGVAIERMRLGVPAPPLPKDRQSEVADKVRRFIEGS